ncbi:MAG: hypothetical protein JWM27_90 [Gemmatimonadetes bacterium]|nr:hypothetical protein [Gemmatimonadota bacterium]
MAETKTATGEVVNHPTGRIRMGTFNVTGEKGDDLAKGKEYAVPGEVSAHFAAGLVGGGRAQYVEITKAEA